MLFHPRPSSHNQRKESKGFQILGNNIPHLHNHSPFLLSNRPHLSLFKTTHPTNLPQKIPKNPTNKSVVQSIDPLRKEIFPFLPNRNPSMKYQTQTENINPQESMIGENRQLVTDAPVEVEKQPVEAQDCRKITDHFRGIYRKYPIW